MKKTVMAAVCAATLLTGTAFANDYPITHPFYMPDKGHSYVDAGYDYTKCKYKDEGAKWIWDDGCKDTSYSLNYTYAVNDKLFVKAGYADNKSKADAELVGFFGYIFDPSYDLKTKNWYLGLADKFVDNDNLFCKGSFAYYQQHGDEYDGQDKGIALEVFCGCKAEWADPYVNVRYTNTINRGSENDGICKINVGAYRQINEKFGVNLGINYTQETDDFKDKYLEACFDLRYAFTKQAALRIGYGFQLSDSQDKAVNLEGIGLDKYSLKTKSRNHFFASLMFSF